MLTSKKQLARTANHQQLGAVGGREVDGGLKLLFLSWEAAKQLGDCVFTSVVVVFIRQMPPQGSPVPSLPHDPPEVAFFTPTAV